MGRSIVCWRVDCGYGYWGNYDLGIFQQVAAGDESGEYQEYHTHTPADYPMGHLAEDFGALGAVFSIV